MPLRLSRLVRRYRIAGSPNLLTKIIYHIRVVKWITRNGWVSATAPLLGGLAIERVNQVWCADVTYVPMAKGFLYLVVIMDWVSRAVLAWRLSNTLAADFCVEALEEALARYGRPEIFNTDQGSQFTSDDFTGTLKRHRVMISMDGKGRCMDNIFVERLWRSLKYEEVYLHAYATVAEARTGIGAWLSFYNDERQHQSLGYRTPRQIYQEGLWICGRSALPSGGACPLSEPARKARKCSPSPTYPQAPPTTMNLLMMK